MRSPLAFSDLMLVSDLTGEELSMVYKVDRDANNGNGSGACRRELDGILCLLMAE